MKTRGPAYDSAKDGLRLDNQINRIKNYGLAYGGWLTLFEFSEALNYPEASVSAQLRHLRKEIFGAYVVEKRRRSDGGLWEYKIMPPKPLEYVQQDFFKENAHVS